VYSWSALVVCGWGFVQLGTYYLNVPYPAFLFNSSSSNGASLYQSEYAALHIKRLASVAVEPSVLAQYLLTVLPFLLLRIMGDRPLLSRRWDKAVAGVVIITVLLTTSTSGYVGLIVLGAMLAVYSFRTGMLRVSHVVSTVIVGALLLILVMTSQKIGEFVSSDVFGKLDTYSGLERSGSIQTAFMYFRQYPILGIGWGSVVSHDLVVKLLSNTGVIGFTAFVLFMGSVFGRLRQANALYRNSLHDIVGRLDVVGCAIGLSVLIVLNLITEFSYVFGHLWFLLALSLASFLAAKSNCADRLSLSERL
jgi:O-antigen ligase